jgi:hypothetical protein
MGRFLILLVIVSLIASGHAFAQQQEDYRMNQLEQRVDGLDHKVKADGDAVMVLFLFGAFCALWAQNTGRSAWLWFFLGMFFNVITIFFLLTKNSNDNFERREFGRTWRERRRFFATKGARTPRGRVGQSNR